MAVTGGMGLKVTPFRNIKTQEHRFSLSLSGRCLHRNFRKMKSLMSDMIFEPDFSDHRRILELINSRKAYALPMAGYHGHRMAMLAAGRKTLPEIGEVTDKFIMPDWVRPRRRGRLLQGEVVHVDRFGNVVSNITRADIQSCRWRRFAVSVAGREFERWGRTYADVEEGEALVLFNSAGLLEVAVRNGSAADEFGLGPGVRVEVVGE